MELRFDGCGYSITGTPTEMWEFLTLEDEPKQAEATLKVDTSPAVVKTPEPAPEPAPKKPRKAPETDWGNARALRKAGWTYANIARELHVSPQTIANHLGGKADDE